MLRALTTVVASGVTFAVVAIGGWQTRDAGAQAANAPPPGSAVLTGVLVTDTANPQPVRRATVRFAGGAGTSSRLVGTDEEGRFRFDRLAAGTYTLSASKPGFVPTFYGSRHPGRGPAVPVAVADAQRVEVTIRILPGAVITGVLTDAQGNPAGGVPVTAVEARPTAGTAAPAPVRATTDDLGTYRLYGLAPGEYLVSASPPLVPARDFRVPPTASAAIGLTSAADVQWARSGGVSGTSISTPRLVAYAPVFFPGTTNAADAGVVKVASGEERSGVGMTLRIVPVSRIAGSLVDPSGQAVTVATVTLYPRRRGLPTPADELVASGALVLPRATVSAAGFVFSGVAPGEYTLVARTGSGQRGARPPAGTAEPITLWNVTDLTVEGTDRGDLTLQLQPGLTLSGSMAFERTSLAPPVDLSTTEVLLVASNPIPGVAQPRAVVSADGTFRFNSIAPGAYLLRATAPSAAAAAGWTFKSAVVNARDIADRLIESGATGETVGGLVVTFTDRAAEIAGRVIDAADQPVTRYSIVVFTTDKSLWLPNARRIRWAQPATDGTFSVAGLPAGEYGIAGIGETPPGALSDPSFLSALLASAFKVIVAEGQRHRQDLRVK